LGANDLSIRFGAKRSYLACTTGIEHDVKGRVHDGSDGEMPDTFSQVDLLVVLLEALLGEGAPMRRGLTERGWHGTDLVGTPFGAPSPIATVPSLRPHLAGLSVPVQLEAFSGWGELKVFSFILV
jgi:hypothetical protein